ncbi:efflux transporter outer membrane subunit [Simiduia curdlanivorans]|uniref:Efflux transporter outer membrane subunit n=1 Tax=Simiduia curdlanivorans TaxID=1492769 RepID=A0ABV8V361_9GAMM|nr:efflux transporter outer membrane subunit [Simiduia curdlanivorans]MDN3637471.1 efflux transporter outer membrane subunit [Simiduia curdlanivorans]
MFVAWKNWRCLALAFGLAACAYQPATTLPELTLPDVAALAGTTVASTQSRPQTQWWQTYGSAELAQLFRELELNSLDLAVGRERLDQAKALRKQQTADNWPSLNVQASQRTAQQLGADERETSSGLNFTAAYEIDLWGSRSAANYGARISELAQQQEYQSLQLQLQANLAKSYFELIALQDRYTIALQNQQASKELLDLIQLRFEAGSASGIELSQQRNTWLATSATVLGLQRAVQKAEGIIAVLVGRESLQLPASSMRLAAVALPDIRSVQSAALLEYRPDIKLAESQLRLTESLLYQEQQKRWPSLQLSAGLGLDELFNSGGEWTASLIGSAAAPIFNAGKIREQINAATSDVTIAQLNYRAVVLQAMQDAVETLSELAYQKALYQVRAQELENNRQLYDLARLRYDSGDTDFINLLTAQRSWFSARDSLLQAKNQQLAASVNLFAALGVAPELAPEITK